MHSYSEGFIPMIEVSSHITEEKSFAEFRKKVRTSELLSSAILHLLRTAQFTGRVSVILQNGRVLKSGYEEGYFRNFNSNISSTVQ